MAEEDDFFIKFRELPDDIELFPNQKNFIKSIISHPCARPWYVWIETFIPSFIVLLATVAFFDVEDAIRDHGKQISGKSGKGRKGRHSPKIRVAGRKQTIERWQQKGLRTLLVVTQPLENLGFAWLLYAGVDQFFHAWQTLLENSDFCTQPIVSGPMQRTRGPGFISFVESGAAVIMTDGIQNRGAWPNNVFIVTLPEGLFNAFFVIKVKGPIGGVDPVWCQLRAIGFFGATDFRSETVALNEGEEGTMLISARFFLPFQGGGTLSWSIGGSTIPAGIECVSARVIVQRVG